MSQVATRLRDMLGTGRTREPYLGSGQEDSKHLQRHTAQLRNPEDKPSPRDMSRDSIRGLK